MQSNSASYHTCVYAATKAASASYTSLNLVVGSGDTVQDNKYFPNQDMELLTVFGYGTDLSAVRISTPRLRGVAPLDIHPFVVGSAIPTNANICSMITNPPLMFASENIDVQTSNGGTGTPVHRVILNLGVRPRTRAKGQKYRIIATSGATLTPNQWTTTPLTYNANLPHGVYEIQNITPISATGIAARLIVPGEYYRPGSSCLASLGDRLPWPYYEESLGNLGRFDTRAYPQAEFLASGADTSQTIIMDLCKIA